MVWVNISLVECIVYLKIELKQVFFFQIKNEDIILQSYLSLPIYNECTLLV